MYLVPRESYFVYIMSNRFKTLYTGITNSPIRRVAQDKRGEGSAFTTRYKLDRSALLRALSRLHRAI